MLLVLVIGFLEGNVCAQSAQQGRAGNMLFKIPSGWQQVEREGLVLILPKDAPEGSCFIAILPGQPLNFDLRKGFDTIVAKAIENERVLERSEVTERRTDEGYDVLVSSVVTENQDGVGTIRIFVGGNPGNRFEMAFFQAVGNTIYKRYKGTFDQFLETVQFASIKSPAAKTPGGTAASPTPSRSNAGGLNGLFFATERGRTRNNRLGGYNYFNRKIYRLFLPDGSVYRARPQGGLNNFTIERARQFDPGNCGYYKVSGGQIQFNWGDGESETLPFTLSGGALTIGSTTLRRIDSPNAVKLRGSYASTSFTDTSSNQYGSTGGASNVKRIVFRADGTFVKTGAFLNTDARGGVISYESERSSGSGNYRISNATLELIYNDGTREQFTIIIPAGNATPGLIEIEDDSYLLE